MSSSMPSELLYRVTQYLVLGPILFLLYTGDFLQLISRHHLVPLRYAGDTQICGFCQPSQADDLTERVSVLMNG